MRERFLLQCPAFVSGRRAMFNGMRAAWRLHMRGRTPDRLWELFSSLPDAERLLWLLGGQHGGVVRADQGLRALSIRASHEAHAAAMGVVTRHIAQMARERARVRKEALAKISGRNVARPGGKKNGANRRGNGVAAQQKAPFTRRSLRSVG